MKKIIKKKPKPKAKTPKIESRKDVRKQKRLAKKVKRLNHQKLKQKKSKIDPQNQGKNKRDIEFNDDEEIPSDFESDVELPIPKPKPVVQKKNAAKPPEQHKSTLELLWKKEKDSHKKLQREMKRQRVKQLKRANEDDDRVIKSLEKKLRINKLKSNKLIPSMFNDGLDYALELCLPDKPEEKKPKNKNQEKPKYDSEDDDFGLCFDSENEMMGDEENSEMSDDGDAPDDDESVDADDDESDDDILSNKNEENKLEDENENDPTSSDGEISNKKQNKSKKSKTITPKTDIYGRAIDETGVVIEENKGKYIPPHLRAQMNTESEKVLKLKRQLKGHLNRLAESNLPKVAKEIDRLYMENSRNDMNNTLSSLVLDALVINVLSSDRAVLEHMLLLAVLHANVGSEVGKCNF